jgi:hypothetical protein
MIQPDASDALKGCINRWFADFRDTGRLLYIYNHCGGDEGIRKYGKYQILLIV